MTKYESRLIRCRVFGHAWDEVPIGRVIDEYAAPVGYREVVALQCMRCKTARIDAWSRWGVLGGRKYIYEDDYKEMNHTLKEESTEDDSSWHTAKKRYVELRRAARKAEMSGETDAREAG